MMSRGSDLVLTRLLREWSFSCKKRKKGSILSLNAIRKELEKHDFCLVGEDREIPLFIGYLPKVVEFVGQTEAEDFENQYLPNGTEGA
jgi:hypothetical protein